MGSIATGHPGDLLSFNAADAKEVKRPAVVQKQVDQLEIYDIFNYYELEYYRTMVQHDETILQLRAGTASALEGTSVWFEHMLKQYDVVDTEMRRKAAILLIYHAGGLNPDGTADPLRAKQVNQCLKQSQALNTYIKRLRLAALIGSESRDRLNVDMCHVLNLLYLLITFNHEDKDFCRVLRAEDSIPKSVVCLLFDLVRCYNIEKNKTYPFKKLVTVLFCCLNSGLGSATLIESAKKSLLHQWGISKHGSNSKCSIHDLLSFEKHVTSFKCDQCSGPSVKEASSPKESVKESPACDHKCQPHALVEGLNILRGHLSLPFADVKQLIVTSQRSTANDTKSLWELVHVVRQKQHADDSTAIGTLTICDSVNHVTYFDVIYRTLLPSWSEIIKICLDVMFSTVTARHDNSVSEVFYFMNELESRDWVREAARDTRRELPRHQSLLFSLLAHFLVLLLKHARYSNVMHFEYLTALITQYRGIELCLKFLSQDLSTFLTSFVLHVTEMQSPRPRDSTPEPEHDSSDSDTERDADMITHSGSDLSVKELQRRVVELNIDLTRTHPHESRALHAVTSTVKLLRKMIREHPFRIAYVVKFKAQTTLKRLNEIDHEDLKLEFYKLVKTMLPYIHKKWRAKQMSIISQIYYKVRPRLHDNWLSTTFSRESDADPNQFRELENAALKSIEIYHHVRYSAAAAGQSSHTATARRYSFDRSPRERPQLGPGNTSPTTERTA